MLVYFNRPNLDLAEDPKFNFFEKGRFDFYDYATSYLTGGVIFFFRVLLRLPLFSKPVTRPIPVAGGYGWRSGGLRCYSD